MVTDRENSTDYIFISGITDVTSNLNHCFKYPWRITLCFVLGNGDSGPRAP